MLNITINLTASMGVKNLSDIFGQSNYPIKKETQISHYKDKKLAFDAFNVLFQFLASIRDQTGRSLVDDQGNVTSHLVGILLRNSNLIQEGIRPVYVFDGKSHPLKAQIQEERRKKREIAKEEYEKALNEGDLVRARKFATRANYLTSDMIDDAKKLLSLMGIPVIDAPGEGEAQAAQLSIEGQVYGAATQDYDALLFGSPIIVRNLNISGKRALPGGGVKLISPEEIDLNILSDKLNLNRLQLIDLGILLGSDFNPEGVKGIGPKSAYKYIKKYGSFIETEKNVSSVKDASIPYKDILDIFLKPNVTKNINLDFTHNYDVEAITKFLVDEKNFSEGRYLNIIQKTNRVIEDTQKQTNLDDFF